MPKFVTLFILIIFVLSALASEAKSPQKIVNAIKIDNPVDLDGVLNEKVWNGSSISGFVQRDPDEGEPSTEETNVWVAYDESSIYIAARLYDENPDQIDASLARKDNWIESDWFFFYVDPYGDKRTGYYFAVNPGGTQMDGILFNDSWDDNSWDGIWEAESRIDELGWSVEMRIPFTQLRFKEENEMKWGVNFQRRIKKNNERAYFVMVPKDESGFVSRFAVLDGLNGVKSKQRLEVFPYLVQKAKYLDHEKGDPFYKSSQYSTNVGADIKVGLASNLNLDIAINPDFGQVEVDPAVVNLSASETFYNEKRPFFIEGNNIFYTGIYANNNWGFNMGWPDIFYSRRIGRSPQGSLNEKNEDADYSSIPGETNILGAAKLTGKLGSWSIGAISAVTERTYAHAYFSNPAKQVEQEIEPLTHYGVFRSKREMNNGMQGLGFMATSVNRDLSDNFLSNSLTEQAYTFGFDGFTFLDEEQEYIVSAAAFGSYASGSKEAMINLQERYYRYMQRPDASFMKIDSSRTSIAGSYARVMLNKQKGAFYINSALGVITPGFEYNDLGYQWMADKINAHTIIGYRWFKPDGIFRFKRTYIAYANEHDFDGNLTQNRFYTNNYFEFENYYWVWFGGGYNLESMSKFITRGGPIAKYPLNYWAGLEIGTDNRKSIVVGLNYYYEGDRLGSVDHDVELEIQWKPSTQVLFSIEPGISINKEKVQYVDAFEDNTADHTYNNRYVFGEIDQVTFSSDIRLNWTFTPALSLQLFVQPLFSVGDYENYKELAAARTYEYFNYGTGKSTIELDTENDEYIVDPDGDGPAEEFRFENPDFNFKSFKANLILRWEVMPGSIFFFAWTHDRTNDFHPGDFKFRRDFDDLWKAPTNNIFLIKYSHWLNI